MRLRFSYSPSIDYSFGTTALLAAAWLLTGAALVVFNFITQAKQQVCVATPTTHYDANSCPPASLAFWETYWTMPLSGNVTVGTFPWQASAFGNSTDAAPIDYSILQLNWTANPLQCALLNQVVTLHLDSQSSTASACYYCGPALRMLCMTIDSERTSVPLVDPYLSIMAEYNILFTQLYRIVSTAIPSSTIGSLQLKRRIALDGLPKEVVGINDTVTTVKLGTTSGFYTIRGDDANAAVAQIATSATNLLSNFEMITSRDLQPDAGDLSTSKRTFLVNYSCRRCRFVYKPAREIVAIVLGSTTAILSFLFFIYRQIAEFFVTRHQHPIVLQPSSQPSPPLAPAFSSTSFTQPTAVGGGGGKHQSPYPPISQLAYGQGYQQA